MNHPPTEQNQLLAKLMGYVQMAGFGLLFAGRFLFSAIKMPEPAMVTWMSENKMNAFCLVFMLGFLSTQLLATGAFEVYYNGQLVYSKLDQGKIPHIQEVIRGLELYGVTATPTKY